MAPRGRAKKVGLMRMDAAIDALTPMGYSPDFIRQKVKELLKVYGEEGWTFIEEGAYTLLIEYILENQEGGRLEIGEPSSQQDSPNETRGQDAIEAGPSEAGPSQEATEPLRCDQDALLLSPITVLNPPLPASEAVINSNVKSALDEVNQQLAALKEACMDPPGFEHLPSLQASTTEKRRPCLGWIGPKDDDNFEHLQLAQGSAKKRRKPCLGWIGPKDDDDFVLLEPAPVQGRTAGERQRKRKSRWDVGPDDIV